MKRILTAAVGTALTTVGAGAASADGPSAGCASMICTTTVTVTHGGGGGGSHPNGGGRSTSGGGASAARSGGGGAPSVSFFPGSRSSSASSSAGGGSSSAATISWRPFSLPMATTGKTCMGVICIPTPQISQANGAGGVAGAAPAAAPAAAGAPAQAQQAAAPAPPPVPTAAQWTQAVRTQMKLTNPKIGSAPCAEAGCMGAVGVPVWLWATDLDDKSMTVTLGPYSVSARASVPKMSFNLGDGRSISCIGKGTPYDTSKGWAESPDCGTKYLKKGKRTVTATATWHVTWTGVNTGDLDIPASSRTTLTIGEYQALTQ